MFDIQCIVRRRRIIVDIWQVTKRSQVERRAQVKDQRSNAICEVDLHEVEKLQVHNLMEIAQLAWFNILANLATT